MWRESVWIRPVYRNAAGKRVVPMGVEMSAGCVRTGWFARKTADVFRQNANPIVRARIAGMMDVEAFVGCVSRD